RQFSRIGQVPVVLSGRTGERDPTGLVDRAPGVVARPAVVRMGGSESVCYTLLVSTRNRLIERATVCVFLACLIGFGFHYMRPMLLRTWFFHADEYVVAAEVIRFSQLDFRQHFFDI